MSSKKNAGARAGNTANDRAKREPPVIGYDEAGRRIGDDGYAMTRIRTRMHRLFDGYIIWAVIVMAIGFLCMLLAFQQGAEYRDWEVVATGGNQYRGWDVAFLLRMEALLCLYTAVLSVIGSFFGFRWFYDRKPAKRLNIVLAVMAAGSLAFTVAALALAGFPDPVSLVNLCIIILTLATMSAVRAERPTLEKAEVASTRTR